MYRRTSYVAIFILGAALPLLPVMGLCVPAQLLSCCGATSCLSSSTCHSGVTGECLSTTAAEAVQLAVAATASPIQASSRLAVTIEFVERDPSSPAQVQLCLSGHASRDALTLFESYLL